MAAGCGIKVVLPEFKALRCALAKRTFHCGFHFAVPPGERDGPCASSCVEVFLGDVHCL